MTRVVHVIQGLSAAGCFWADGVDVWLSYFAADDLEEWVEFLKPRLETLIRTATDEPTNGESHRRPV